MYVNYMLMVWDEPKRETNLQTHGFDFADARDRFEWGTAIVVASYPDPATGNARFNAIGRLDGVLVFMVFAPLGTEAISCISLRRANRKERQRYAEG